MTYHPRGALPITLDPVLRAVGFALWQTQDTENALVHHLVLVHEFPAGGAIAEVEAAFEEASKQPLGRLLSRLRVHDHASQALVSRLGPFLGDRNWLVHRSRLTNRADLYHVDRTEAFLARLTAIADAALGLSKAIQASTETHLETRGVSKAYIDAKAEEIRRAWVEA